MTKCEYCGTQNYYREEWPYCKNCGAPVEEPKYYMSVTIEQATDALLMLAGYKNAP